MTELRFEPRTDDFKGIWYRMFGYALKGCIDSCILIYFFTTPMNTLAEELPLFKPDTFALGV